LDETLYVLAPDQWDVIAKTLAIKIDQTGTVFRFLSLHFLEYLGGCRIGLP